LDQVAVVDDERRHSVDAAVAVVAFVLAHFGGVLVVGEDRSRPLMSIFMTRQFVAAASEGTMRGRKMKKGPQGPPQTT